MSENKLSPENYYKNYGGWDLSLLYERMKGMGIPENLLKYIREKESVRFLILGSATTNNLNQAAKIDQYLRPGKVEQDEVVIIDRNKYPLDEHKKEADWIEGKAKDAWSNTPKSTPEFPYPKFEIVQADIRQLPFADKSFDLVISDYTLNYLDSLKDVDGTFHQISEVLSPDGLAVVSIRGNDKYPYSGESNPEIPNDEVQNKNQGGVDVHYLPIQAYIDLASKNGLIPINQNLMGSDLCIIFKK